MSVMMDDRTTCAECKTREVEVTKYWRSLLPSKWCSPCKRKLTALTLHPRFVCQRERGGEQQIKRVTITNTGGRTTEVLKVKGVMV